MSTLDVGEITGASNVAKAWVNFNGTGTVAIRDSYNIDSVTDNSTGNYTANFTTSMANSNYATAALSQNTANTIAFSDLCARGVQSANSVNVGTGFYFEVGTNNARDHYEVNIIVFGELA